MRAYAAIARPLQSNAPGPDAACWYGCPTWASANATTAPAAPAGAGTKTAVGGPEGRRRRGGCVVARFGAARVGADPRRFGGAARFGTRRPTSAGATGVTTAGGLAAGGGLVTAGGGLSAAAAARAAR